MSIYVVKGAEEFKEIEYGGDSVDWEREDDRLESIFEEMREIEKVLGEQDYLNLGNDE